MAYPIPSKYSNAYELRAIALAKLEKSLLNCGALPDPVVRLLVDQYLLISNVKRTAFRGKMEYIDLYDHTSEFEEQEAVSTIAYYDYSFVVAPAYKAFEGFLLFLARVFELPAEQYEHRIGGLYDWEANKKDKEIIIKALEAKLGTDREGKDRWSELSMTLRNYRHNPAHFSGDRIETFEQAEDYVRTIINIINQTVKFLVEKKVLSSGLVDTEAICKI